MSGNFCDDKYSDNSDRPTAIAWSPNGKMLATGSWKTVKIWDAETGRQLQAFSVVTYWTASVSFSADNQRLYACDDSVTKIFDTGTGRELKAFDRPNTVFTPDGKKFVSARDERGFWIYDAETGNLIKPGKVLTDYVNSVSYSPDGKRIMIASRNSATIYDAESTDGLGYLYGHIASVASSAFSPDGKWIVTGSGDGTIRIWSAETFIEKARFIAYDDGEWLSMTPDGYYTASANGEKYINARVGNTVTGIDRYRSTFNKPAVVAARLSNSGRMTHNEAIVSVSVNPGGTRIAATSHDKIIKLWDLESGKELRTISNIGGYANAVSWSPDGKYLINGAEDKTVRIWDADTGRSIRTITGHTDYVNEARYSPDGKRIASCADDKLVKIWDAETGREIRTLTGHTDMVPVVAWSPDGKRIASGSDKTEKTIRIWDAETGRVLQTIPGQGGRIRTIAFSPDGRKLASITMEDKAIKIWDVNTGKQIRSLSKEYTGDITTLGWSPNGKYIASGAIQGVEVWEAETGERVRTIIEECNIFTVGWTPDGRRIIAGCTYSDTQFIKVFDALTGKEL
jgi:WD40 repeat protein